MNPVHRILLLLLVAAPSLAAEPRAPAAPPGALAEAPAAVREGLRRFVPGLVADRIEPAAVAGLYRVFYGARLVYVSADGRYLVQGKVVDLANRRDLTDLALGRARRDALAALDPGSAIEFAPAAARFTVNVFTDVDCPYCAKLHAEIDQYNALGIAVRYLAFPRAGIPSPSYDRSVSVWCADDRRQAITAAKAGRAVPAKTCDNPVATHFALGRELGVEGTPTIVLEDGRVVPGYVPAAELLRRLQQPAG